MKKTFKKLILSITLSLSMIMGSIAGMLLPLMKLGISNAEYKPSTAYSEDFENSTGWSKNASNDTALTNAFDGSKSSVLISSDTWTEIDVSNKPSTKYDGTELTENAGLMLLHAKNAPLKTQVDAKDEDGNKIYQKDGDNFIYEKESDGITNKVYETIGSEDANDFVLVNADDASQGYYKKLVQKTFVNTYYSFKNSSSISLSKNSWYVISAYVWTKNAVVSMYVQDSNKDFNTDKSIINTDSAWKKINIFVETSADSSASVYIYFYYGGKNGLTTEAIADIDAIADDAVTGEGFIYVDHVLVQKISEIEYNNKTIDGETTEAAYTADYTVRYNYDISTLLENADFQSALTVYNYMYDQDNFISADANATYQKYINHYTDDNGTTKLSKNQLSNLYNAYDNKFTASIVTESEEFKTTDGETETPGKDTFQTENKILKLINTSEKYNLGLLTPQITLSQFGYYRLSLYVKATEEDAEATVKLVSFIKDGNSMALADYEDGSMIVKTQSVTGFTDNSDFTNNWVEVSFYIQANVYRNATFQIALLANASNTVYFDNIRLESVSSSTYSNASSAAKFDMSPSSLVLSGGITNGYFDYIKTTDAKFIENIESPYTPASWTELDDNNKDVVAGIVSTQTVAYNVAKAKLANAANPLDMNDAYGIAYPRTNVLAMYAPNDDASVTYEYGYKSTSFSLSSNSVYKISFQAFTSNTVGAEFNGKIVAKLIYSDDAVSTFEEEIIAPTGLWTNYTFVVKTGSTSRTCYLELGIEEAQGTIFFQKAGYTTLASKTIDGEKITIEDQYKTILSENSSVALQNANHIKFVDFEGDSSVMHSSSKIDDKDYYEPLGYKLAEVTDGETGTLAIVDTTDLVVLDSEVTLNQTFIKNNDSPNDLAMVIYNKNAASSKATPVYTTTLSSSSYYEISMYVKTARIANSKGLAINMDQISVNFANINTGAINDVDNNYVKYTVYVKTGSSSISGLEISYILGTESDKVSGIAVISDLNIKKFADANEYNTAIADVEKTDETTVIKDLTSSSDETPESKTDDPADNMTLATFFLVLSSILLAVALVIAIVAVFVKKMPKHTKVVGSNNANIGKNKKHDSSSKDGFV